MAELLDAPPTISSVTVAGADLVLNCTGGLAGRTYYTLTSTDLTLPLNQWTPVATNTLGTGGTSVLGHARHP